MSDRAEPPTPEGVPLLGNSLGLTRDPLSAIQSWAGHGDVVRLRFPGRSMVLVTGPDEIAEMLVEKPDRFTIGRPQRETFEDIEDDALTTNTGDRWERLRTALRPAFTREAIESYAGRMADRTAETVDAWTDGERVALHREMRLLTLRILGDTLLGVDVEGDEGVVVDAADAFVARTNPRGAAQVLPDWVPTPTDRRFRKRFAALDEYLRGVVESHDADGDDVCSVMLSARDRGELSTSEVLDNLVGLLLAGHVSTAATLTYAWYELSRTPDVRESVVAEVESVVGDGLPDARDFRDLDLTRRVIRETLRLYPPTWAVSREATRPVTVAGYDFPEGTQFTLSPWALHRDERFWDRPDEFDPGRWTDADHPEYAYFPFSGGPRHCIGMRFAKLELATAVATMVSRVDLDVDSTGDPSFVPAVSLWPADDLGATVERC